MKWRGGGEASPLLALMMFWAGLMLLLAVFVTGVLGQLVALLGG